MTPPKRQAAQAPAGSAVTGSDPKRLPVFAGLDRDRAEQIASIFHLLGEPNRLAILVACMTGARSVNDLAALTGMSPSLTSHHLRLLKAARLVRAERRGKFVDYSVHDHHVTSVLTDMIEHVAEPDHGPSGHAAEDGG